MADDELRFERKGMRPTSVEGLGGGHVAIGYQPNDKASRVARALQTVFTQEREKEQRRIEKLKTQFDMYKVLRDSGYDPKSAHEAVQKKQFPSVPGGENLATQKTLADIEKSKAQARKADADANRQATSGGTTGNYTEQRETEKANALNFIAAESAATDRATVEREIRETYKKVRMDDPDIQKALEDAYPEEAPAPQKKEESFADKFTGLFGKPKRAAERKTGRTKRGMDYTIE